MAFEKGAVVRLKSGGPKMTVDVPETQLGGVYCIWFDGTKKLDGEFNDESLELAVSTPQNMQVQFVR